MTISLNELRNGLELEQDLVFPEKPSHPEMRESTSVWMFDETGAFGFPGWASKRKPRRGKTGCSRPTSRSPMDGLNGAGRGPAPSPFGAEGARPCWAQAPSVSSASSPSAAGESASDGPAIDSHVRNQIARTVVRTGAPMRSWKPR